MLNVQKNPIFCMQACFCMTPFDPLKMHKNRRSVDRHEAQITNLSQSVKCQCTPETQFFTVCSDKSADRHCGDAGLRGDPHMLCLAPAHRSSFVPVLRRLCPALLCQAPHLCASRPLCAFRQTAAAMPINASSVAGGGRGCPLGAYPSLDGNEAGHPAFVTLDHLSFARRVSVAQESTPPHAGAGDARPRES